MLSKIKLIIFTIVLLGGSFYYFSSNSSYQNSVQARVYYFLGNYDSAYELAQKAYEEDSYNKMANTVMTQSKIAKSYESYINQGNEYLKKIDAISSKKEYTPQDKTRIKMMCEIMIEAYEQLKPSTLTEDSLITNSKKMQKKFKQLHEELF
jgi:tRNA U34 5-carboxymethylaminomethyl modifying enzyme MnmG/GidA